MSFLKTLLGFLGLKLGGLPLLAKAGIAMAALFGAAWGGWWWKATLAEAAEAEHLKVVIGWYEEQNKLSRERYEQHYLEVQKTSDYYRRKAAEAADVATPECTDLGAEWRRVFNDLSRKANTPGAGRSDGAP